MKTYRSMNLNLIRRYVDREYNLSTRRYVSSKEVPQDVKDSYKILNLPRNSNQDAVRKAFINLAKQYHPDSCSSVADVDKFVAAENAFRVISKYNTGSSNSDEVEKIVYDIKHTAPQHRQYLSFEGVGHGTPSQREKQWQQVKAQRAATNVLEHRISKAVASDKTLMKKESTKKHDIKTKYGFDRLVEDLIQEAMSKGEFDNLEGKGKPLKNQNINPYVDFTTHKLNEVLINNGFTPEWITMNKEITQDIELLKEEIRNERMYLGPLPLSNSDDIKWKKIYESNKNLAESINIKINKYNLIVPLLHKQRLHIEFDEICDNILTNGVHSLTKKNNTKEAKTQKVVVVTDSDVGMRYKIIKVIFKILGDLTFKQKKDV